MMPGTTPSQTVGPFFAIGLPWPDGELVVPEGTAGAIRLHGTVYDGARDPVPDAMVETWQADPDGGFAHPHDPRGAAGSFRGFGRSLCDGSGRWSVVTVKPGRVPGPGESVQAPHVDVSVFARGLLNRVVTRLYFADEADANAADPALRGIAGERERATLLAQPDGDGGYRFDIHLQGDDETVFFAV
jgi:protocatechuate 3,4-dioxygenase alpha subunit